MKEDESMKIIALDSSGLVASAAILCDDTLLAEYTVNYKKTHSQTLLPMLDEIIRMTEFTLDEIDAIAVAEGPGSFTGLRIGAATAKGLGLVLNKPLIGIPTVDALAYHYYATDAMICPMMDARRNQVYTGLYEFEQTEKEPFGKFHVIEQQKAIAVEEMLQGINKHGRKTIFLGDGADVYQNQIINLAKVPISFAPPHLSKQRAGAVGALAIVYLKEGKTETAADHVPVYLRLSQAERERLQMQH